MTDEPDQRLAYVRMHDRDWLHNQYWHQQRALADIAAEVGVTPATVLKAMRRQGIATRPARTLQFPKLSDRDWLYEQYWTQGRTLSSIAAEVGCAPEAVRKAILRAGIPRRPRAGRGQDNPRHSRFPQLNDSQWLYGQYWQQARTLADIAAEAGCSVQNVSRAMRRHGIPRRPSTRQL